MSAFLGWAATAVVVASYFFKGQRALRAVQMLGAAMWMIYGVTIDAMPVIAANVLVLAAAAWTMKRRERLTLAPSLQPESLNSSGSHRFEVPAIAANVTSSHPSSNPR